MNAVPILSAMVKSSLAIVTLFASPSLARDYVSRVTLKDGIRVTLTERDFDPRLFKMQGCNSQTSLCVINGQETHTEHQAPPKTYLASIVVEAFGQSYSLPVDNMFDPVTPNRVMLADGKGQRVFGAHCYEAGWCTFRGVFGEGGNVYSAQWEMFEGRIRRTILTGDKEISDWMRQHLDPDHFD
jgi:hypothetical protein